MSKSIHFRFEKLDVWQNARKLNSTVYRLTRQFPSHELYTLTSQIRRASISISSNIAEGSGRNSDKDFAHFLEQAYGSSMELASQFYLALDESYLASEAADPVFERINAVAGQLVSLNRSLHVPGSKVRIV